MTPERLAEIEATYQVQSDGHAQVVNMLLEEVCRLWAERDARLLVGQPVSEDLLTRAKRWRHDTSRDNEAAWPMTLSTVDLIDHIAFLERLLADADDLPQVRRTGYADGWRAAMVRASRIARYEDLSSLEQDFSDMAEAGPDGIEE